VGEREREREREREGERKNLLPTPPIMAQIIP
jgi:hypothetical protein